MRRTNAAKMLVLYPIFLLLAALILYPLVWMFYSSFKGQRRYLRQCLRPAERILSR